MDFTKLSTAAGASESRPVHLRCAATGRALFDNEIDPYQDNGKPCRVWVFSDEGTRAKAALEEIKKRRDAAGADAGDDIHDAMAEVAAPRVDRFENINLGEKLATAADAPKIFALNRFLPGAVYPSFVEQVLAGARDREMWLGNSSDTPSKEGT